MTKYLKNPRLWVILCFLSGFCLSMLGWVFWDSTSPQSQEFNKGLLAYNTGNYDLAVNYFDRSILKYQADPRSDRGFFEPAASVEMAALAQFHKFKALLKMKNGKLAVIAIKEALRLTSAENLSHQKLSESELKRIGEQRIFMQTDLEILFKQQEELAKQEGKGKGKKPAEQGDKPSEDPSKGNQAGKTPRDAL
ncbi:MAG: hypothetical protein K2X27_23085 [Candidatus Obscuribacterales bacterium]|nr:hypothetical protein [Candidatus Obscuribacterales bacterium]